jgi:hypothetical protein
MSDSCCQHDAPEPAANVGKPDGFGVENPRGLDALAFDGETGEAVLIMVEPRPWDGSEQRLFQLQEKVNAYLSFALDGEMTDAFPHLTGKPVRLQLDCAVPPDSMTEHFISAVREHIALQDMKFAVRVVGEPVPAGSAGGCGTGCGCHPEPELQS